MHLHTHTHTNKGNAESKVQNSHRNRSVNNDRKDIKQNSEKIYIK